MKVFYWSLGTRRRHQIPKSTNRAQIGEILDLMKDGVRNDLPIELDVNTSTASVLCRYVANQMTKEAVAGRAPKTPEETVPQLFAFAYGEYKPRMVRTVEVWEGLRTWEDWLALSPYPANVRSLAPNIDPLVSKFYLKHRQTSHCDVMYLL